MELENDLFSIGSEINLPLWDIIRYTVYRQYNYPKKERKKLDLPIQRSKKDLLVIANYIFTFLFGILFKRRKNLLITASRYVDKKGNYFDKSAEPILKALKKEYLIMEPLVGKKTNHKYLYDYSALLTRVYPKKKVPVEYYKTIDKVLTENLGEHSYSYGELNAAYTAFESQCFFYKLVLFFIKPKNLIICTGNPKSLIVAAKKYNVNTFLVQHGGIEKDEIDYSYTPDITSESHILFPENVLTFGSYWGRNINIPAKKVIPIGNDYFHSTPQADCDNSILVVSTIIHGGELKILTKNYAELRPDLKFVFKLHPNDFHLKNNYIDFFKNNKNVSVISVEEETNNLISKAQLVILIVSAVLYEALNQNKKVAVYKRINFERQLIFSNLPNVYFVNDASELDEVLTKKAEVLDLNFYQKTDYSLLDKIFSN